MGKNEPIFPASADFMLPIYLKDQDFSPPDDPIYYLLTQDGLFLVKSTPFFRAAPALASPNFSKKKGKAG